MIKPGVLLIGTTRRDGSARISGVEPLIMESDLWLSMMSGSAKAQDLGRDPRILLHSMVGHFTLFRIDIDDVTYISYEPETGAQHVARWPAGVEYLRPTTTPTSLGPPQPVRRLLG